MNAFTYIRVSGRGQLDGDGPERQRESIAKFAEQFKINLAGGFYEQAVSGTVDGIDRPAFAEMMMNIDERKNSDAPVDTVIVERLDRLARDLMISEVILADFRKRGIVVLAADQGQLIDMASDGGDPTRVLIRQIMGALAQWEKSQLVKKMKVARDRIKAKGGRCEGNLAYGSNPGEKQVLEFLRNNQGISARGLAELLNEGGFKTRRGTKWNRQSVEWLIRKGVK